MFYNLHIIVIVLAIGLVLLNDFIGLFWVLGFKQQFSERVLRFEHRLISVVFLGTIGTGIATAISKPEVFQHNGIWIKIAFVAMIGANGIFLGRKCKKLAQRSFRTLATRTKLCVGASVMLSLFLWFATALAGLFVMHADFAFL